MANEKKKTLRELFYDTLKDIYFAEKKILGALPKMAKAAQAHDLRAAFQKHEAETKESLLVSERFLPKSIRRLAERPVRRSSESWRKARKL
jgi:ferritin-like metal-binding protein YciE